MRKIQDAADKGKIRRIIKQIIGGDKEFSLEVLYNEGENMTDGDEIATEVNDIFGQSWFFQSEEERLKGLELRGLMESGCGAGFTKMAGDMGIPEDVSYRVRGGLSRKKLTGPVWRSQKH